MKLFSPILGYQWIWVVKIWKELLQAAQLREALYDVFYLVGGLEIAWDEAPSPNFVPIQFVDVCY